MKLPSRRGKAAKAARKAARGKKAAAAKRVAAKRRPARKAVPPRRAARPASAANPAARHEVGPTADPIFKLGDRVEIAMTHPPGHRRTPYYIRGKSGTIERYCGAFRNPEELAYGFPGLPRRHLYRVRFRQTDVWPDYKGPAQDTLDLEVFEHWLRRA
jgi:nitrile hydratase